MAFRDLRHALHEPAVTLEAALELNDEGPLPSLTPAPNVWALLPEPVNHPLLRASFREMAAEKKRRIHAFEIDKSLSKAAEDALSHAVQIGFQNSNDGSRNGYFLFCGDRFNQNRPTWYIKWHVRTKPREIDNIFTFMDAFTTRNIISPRFERPVAKCICVKIQKETRLVDRTEKQHDSLPSLPPTCSSVSNYPVNLNQLKLATDKTKKTGKSRGDERKSCHKHKKSQWSSNGSPNIY